MGDSERTAVSIDPVPPAKPRTARQKLRWVFVGRDGLRAGWGALLFLLIGLGVAIGLSRLLTLIVARPAVHAGVPIGFMLLMECAQIAAVLIATAVLAWIEGRSMLDYGLRGQAQTGRFLWGMVSGFAALTLLMLALWLLGFTELHLSVASAAQTAGLAALWLLAYLMTGVFEEMMLRGYLQFALTRGIGFWWGALALSVLFGALHGKNPDETWVGLVTAMVAGFVFCISLWYTGSLWWAIGFHMTWDWGESFFYGTPNSGLRTVGSLFVAQPHGNVLMSGGVTGPEGSVLVFVPLVLVAVLMWARWRRQRHPRFAGSGWKPSDIGYHH
jgi:uncharacterized protein